MPSWLLKTAAHRAICWLPHRHFWNGLFQRFLTKSTVLEPSGFEVKLREAQRHLDAFLAARRGARDFSGFELGTGWYPTIPLSFYLCGAGPIWTIDIDPLLTAERLGVLFEYFWDYEQRDELKKFLPAVRPERVRQLRELLPFVRHAAPTETLSRLQIRVLVGDASEKRLPPNSVDFFFSSAVLEYIPRPVLLAILDEFRRIATPGAVMSHRLNLIDAFSYFDKSITAFNFLRYTDAQWRWRNSPLAWQNRLRISDYRELISKAGFRILSEENIFGAAEDLAKVTLAPEFKGYTQQDLLVLHSFLVSRLEASARAA
jgi:hypothetical protein